MKNFFSLLAVVVIMVSFMSFAEAGDEIGAMIKEASARTEIVLAIENARLYHDYLVAAGAKENKVAENAGFIKETTVCLEKNFGDYCYFAVGKIIAKNPYYSGKKQVPTGTKKK